MSEQKPPLWEVMEQAGGRAYADEGYEVTTGMIFAAEIRAVAEWIEKRQVEDYAVTLPDVREVIGWLTAEADRAERGDTTTIQVNP